MLEFRNSLIDGIFEQLLDNNLNTARITIYEDVGWVRRQWYRFKDCGSLFMRNKHNAEIIQYCWNSQYLKINKRWGNRHPNSKTYFRFDPQSPTGCQGVAGQVRQREEEIIPNLPDISHLDLDASDENDPVIQEYMKKGYISDFHLLKSINKLAPYIYGHIISAKGGKKKLVLVIDSWQDSSPFLETDPETNEVKPIEQNVKSLRNYVKQLSFTYGGKKDD